MNFNIFKTKQKTPHDLVKHVKDAIHKLDGPDKRKVFSFLIFFRAQKKRNYKHLQIGYRRNIKVSCINEKYTLWRGW
jgi:Cys-tRNA synthase (O-phospho-L-seryl-tRNA:Cys-tRNA synthase)